MPPTTSAAWLALPASKCSDIHDVQTKRASVLQLAALRTLTLLATQASPYICSRTTCEVAEQHGSCCDAAFTLDTIVCPFDPRVQAADRTKLLVVRDFGVPLLPPHDLASATIEGEPINRNGDGGATTSSGPQETRAAADGDPRPNAATVRRAAGALLKHRDAMPIDRRRCVAGDESIKVFLHSLIDCFRKDLYRGYSHFLPELWQMFVR